MLCCCKHLKTRTLDAAVQAVLAVVSRQLVAHTIKGEGRVGDAPLPGCGTYADKVAASSATGTGDFVIRAMSCRQISDNVAKGMTIQQAVDAALDYLGREFDADVGLIAIDASGIPYGNHRTQDMPHAWFSGTGEIVAKMRVVR